MWTAGFSDDDTNGRTRTDIRISATDMVSVGRVIVDVATGWKRVPRGSACALGSVCEQVRTTRSIEEGDCKNNNVHEAENVGGSDTTRDGGEDDVTVAFGRLCEGVMGERRCHHGKANRSANPALTGG